jgi:DNA-directed RNA polymerase subunit M/transcription elongation factor TFIIS
MLNPSAEREVNNNYRLSTEKARQWWNNQAFESRKNIVIESNAVINDDQEVEDQMVADVADKDYDDLPDITQQEIDSKIDDEEDIEQIFDLEGESYLQCSKCDDLFTSNEDYDLHKDVDHGEEPEDFEESEETYQLAMNPDLTREALREANSLLTETEERELYSGYDKNGEIQSSVMPYNLPPVATGKYNDNPNEFFYSNKIFRAGDSALRTSSLGEAKANEDGKTTKDDPAICPNCNSDSFGYIMNGQRYEFEDVQSNGKVKCDSCGGEFTPRELVTIADGYYTESKARANEIEVGDVYRMFNYNNGNPICNLCGVNVKDNDDIWEDHLVDTHGYKIESNMRDRDVDIDYIDGSDVPTSGIYESKASEREEWETGSDWNRDVNGNPIGTKYDEEGNIVESKANEFQVMCPKCHNTYDTFAKGGKCEYCGADNREFYGMESKASEDDYEERAEWNWLTNKDSAPEVDYDQVEYEDDGVSDISVPNTEPKGEDKNEFLDDVDYTGEAVDYVYPTKATESTKSYITGINPYEEEYEEFEDSDDEMIEETISIRKLTGYSDNSIAQELHINYGVSHEEALEKVYSVEVSTNDRVAQTFFGKMYKECTESEKDELRMYSGSD